MKLRVKEYPRDLELLANYTYISNFLEPNSKTLLINRARTMRSTIERMNKPWRFSIPREHPLTFKRNDRDFQIDISCEIEGIGDNVRKQNILVRIWSFDEDIYYREGIDHPEIKSKGEDSGGKRVMLRFHFDRRAPNVEHPEPLYHLQVGGITSDNENCWLPKKVDVPRFLYPPMDIILLFELVLINFFHKDYEKIREKPEWIKLVRKSQEFFQRPYFEICYRCFNQGSDTLMGNLVTHTGGL